MGTRHQETFKRGCHALCRDRNAFVQGINTIGQTGLVSVGHASEKIKIKHWRQGKSEGGKNEDRPQHPTE